jgi:predicted class III extradiol MEMO1 family dioxygenase
MQSARTYLSRGGEHSSRNGDTNCIERSDATHMPDAHMSDERDRQVIREIDR